MPTGFFKTELEGDSFWARSRCAFTVAVIRSGRAAYDDYSLEHEGLTYLWADVSKALRVMELQLEGKVVARAHSEGILVNHTLVEVNRELPLEIIALLFCMYSGIVQTRTGG
jgi:hypothetical protein